MRRLGTTLMSALLLFCACDQQAWFDRFVPQEEAEHAKRVLALFASNDIEAIEQQIEPSLLKEDTRASLQWIADQIPESTPTSIEVIGAHELHTAEHTSYNLALQYAYPETWLVADVFLRRQNGELRITGVQVKRLSSSLQEQNRFSFSGKGALHYLVFALAFAIPAFIVATLVVCARTPVPRRKWLWFIFIALGCVQFALNWTDGSWSVRPIGFQLLGSGYSRGGPAAPYILTIGFPLGAILFLSKRRGWTQREAEAAISHQT